MIKRKELQKKSLAAVMAASMTMSLLPGTALADATSGVLADGTYESTAHVTRTAEDDEDENAWDEYDVNVKITVADGKFSDIAVTPGSGYNTENATYFKKAATNSKGFKTKLLGKDATIENIEGWDIVSGATRTSNAVKTAALAATQKATPTPEAVDTTALEKAIADAEALKEADYTADSWKAVQTALTAAKSALSAKESQSAVDTAKDALNTAVKGLVKAPTPTATPTAMPTATPTATPTETPTEQVAYVLMNIPYDEFYAADVNNSVPVDVFSSATKSKTRTATLAGGSYHTNADGSAINGITFPVKVTGVDLSKFKKVTDSDSVSITVTKRGQTSTQTYTGKDALFENSDYAYYVLSEAPSYYKEATVNADGSLSFGKTVGTAIELTNVSPEFMTESRYGDYQLDLDGLENTIDVGTDQIYGVIVSTKEGNDYGMRHVENIWRGTELAWSTGFTTQVHGCPTSSAHYKSMMGQHINKVTYYTSKGIYTIPVNDIFVPTKFESSVSVEDASLSTGKTTMTVTGLPADYDAEYSVDGLDGFAVDGNTISYSANAKKGMYTLTIHDKKGVYADLTQSFTLYTDAMPAAYNEKGSAPALVKAENASEDDFADYIKNITSVKVNGKEYAATGKRKTILIKEDGTLDLTAAAFAEGNKFEIEVTATGYKTLSFTYEKKETTYKYVYAGLTWAEYWAAEGVQAAGSDAGSDETDSRKESDKGAFDVVTRATTNHGLHRGSFQCAATIYMKDGTTYDVAYYTAATTAVLTNGETVTYDKSQIDHYEVKGLKYVPVKVSEDDYEDFCKKYVVVENGGTLSGGFSENKLQSYTGLVADVTENTNGLKIAVKNADGSFSFSAGTTGSESGIKDQALKTAPDAETVGLTVKEANGSYGEFLRVDLTGDYGDLAANLQTVTWTYYGDDSTYTNAKATYGTKFAADNWMHKVMGIQLGLTDSLRCTLPEGTDGTGYWKITIHALGYADASYTFEATKANIVGADPVESTAALEEAIAKADALNKDLYTETSWNNMQTELAEAKEALEKKQSQGTVDEATEHLNAAIEALQSQYVLMNIPYAAFYQAEVHNDVPVDAFTSATKNKTRTASLSGGSYHVNADGSDITGITFPVKVTEGMDLSKYTKVTDEDSVEITVTNRGQTSTTTYTGKDALYENASYAYYTLHEVPSYYKEASVDADGNVTFGAVQGTETAKLENVTAELSTNSKYGDYQLDLDGLTDTIKAGEDTVYGVVVSTKEGNDYGMRHLENIWRVSKLAWSTGFTTSVHNCPTSSEHYKSMMGQTINKITYYTSKGIYEVDADVYVPVKFAYEFSVENASVTSGNASVKLEGLPDDYDAVYTVEGLTGTVSGDTLYFKNAEKGSYTLTVSDKNGKYADLSADFILYTEEMPAAFNEDATTPGLLKNGDATDEEFADYLKNITSVTVNGKAYAASGRGAVVLFNEDGSLKTDAAPFAEGDSFEITVSSLGYQDLSFTWKKSAEEPTPTPTETPTVTPTETPTVTPTETPTVTPTTAPTTTPTTAPTTIPTTQPTKTPTSAPKATSTPLASNKVSNTSTSKKSDNAKTGDATNIWGWVSMAVASLGAGGLGFKLRGRKKKDDEE